MLCTHHNDSLEDIDKVRHTQTENPENQQFA